MKKTPLNILSVSELNQLSKKLLEKNLFHLAVTGEISNFVVPSSGHWYFTLKDKKAQIRCAMFKNRNLYTGFKPGNGTQVIVTGKASIYEGRGDYQLIIDQMEASGDGLLRKAFEELKVKLQQEGLFEQKLKKTLPEPIHCLGIITSPTGAAIRDILSVLQRRFAAIRIILFPVAVQGEGSAEEIVHAVKLANKHQQHLGIDALIVGRGGGSLEDLQAFNEEIVARAIYQSQLPVVSAVGHEIDFTICDLVADRRAATPSAAAELLSPDRYRYQQQLIDYLQQLIQAIYTHIERKRQQLLLLNKQLRHPGQQLQEYQQRLDDLEIRLQQAIKLNLNQYHLQIHQAYIQLLQYDPSHRLQRYRLGLHNAYKQLTSAIGQQLKQFQQQFKESTIRLNAISPLATLARGYAIVLDNKHSVIQDSSKVNIGDKVTTQLNKGSIQCEVIGKTPEKKPQ